MFGRRSSSTATQDRPEDLATAKAGGKGRPTPKRDVARKQRHRPLAAPSNRRESVKQARRQAREERARTRAALMSGDERALPERDRGPVRRHVRDVVDGRRSVAEYFLVVALVVLVVSFVRVPAVQVGVVYAWFVMTVLIVIDSTVLGVRLKRDLRRRFPDQSTKGAMPYAILRSMQMRRLRLPPPRVRPGGRPVTR